MWRRLGVGGAWRDGGDNGGIVIPGIVPHAQIAHNGDGHRVMADLQPVSGGQAIGAFDAGRGPVHERAVGGQVVHPPGVVFVAEFQMPSGNEPALVRQRPVRTGIAPDGQALVAVEHSFEGAAICEAVHVEDAQVQGLVRHDRPSPTGPFRAFPASCCVSPVRILQALRLRGGGNHRVGPTDGARRRARRAGR